MENTQNIIHSVKGSVIAIPAVAALLLGGSIIAATYIAGNAFYKVRALDNTLSVQGSAKTSVESDSAKWSPNITRFTTPDKLQDGIAATNADLAIFKQIASGAGVPDSDISVGLMNYSKDTVYTQDKGAKDNGWNITIPVTINSNDIDKLVSFAGQQATFAAKGLTLQGGSVEYYYSKLPETRVELLADAMKDAHARAEKIAGEGGGTVGRLKSAASGVVQVLAPNSVEVSDYGTYDVSSRTKDIMVTTRATFQLQ